MSQALIVYVQGGSRICSQTYTPEITAQNRLIKPNLPRYQKSVTAP